jgi:branched-chain amino acid transport system permease protein
MRFETQLFQFIVSGLTVGSLYAIVALGFVMIYNATRMINFAQGEFVMLGGMVAAFFYQSLHLPLILCFFLTIIVVSIVGILVERLAVTPANVASVGVEREKVLMTLVMVTIGAAEFIKGRASSDNQIFARLAGIDSNLMAMSSFALSAATGAVAGFLITPITFMEYDGGLMFALKGFCGAVIGGFGNVVGAIVGGFILGLLESLGAGLISSGYKDAIAFICLLIILRVKPTGILGAKL